MYGLRAVTLEPYNPIAEETAFSRSSGSNGFLTTPTARNSAAWVAASSSGHQQNGNLGEFPVGQISLRLTKLPTVHHRHIQIEDDEIGTLFSELVNRFPAVTRHDDLIPVRGQ